MKASKAAGRAHDICPSCGAQCTSEQSPFSEYVNVIRCPKCQHIAVECGSCRKGTMQALSMLVHTVETKCNSCGWYSTGIPRDWWLRNIRTLP